MMTAHPVREQAQAAASVGDSLRLRREQLGWSLAEVGDWLRIKLAYLQALEDGRPQDLPGHTYAIGFLRSYASTLGLDPQELSRRFREETKGLDRRQALNFPVPVAERGIPAGAALLIGVVLVGVTYTGWYVLGGHERLPSQSVPPLPASLAPYVKEPASPAVVPAQASAPPPSMPAVPPPPAATPSAPDPVAASEPIPPAPSAPADAAVIVKASASSWVQVRQAGGPVIYERILQPGESWSAPSGSGSLLLSIGNAGGISLIAGDVSTPALGRSGAVRRNLPLSAVAIRDGTLLKPSPGLPTGEQPARQQPDRQSTGQTPPFLAGSGPGARPVLHAGPSYPEH